MAKREVNKVKMSVTIDIEVNEQVEAEVVELGLSKSTVINRMLNEYLCQKDLRKELLEETYRSGDEPGRDDFKSFLIYKPLTDGVILVRNRKFGVGTNVPRMVIHRSPMGYEWGYSGAGPSDLALNILEAVLTIERHKGKRIRCYAGDCWDVAYKHHVEFRSEFIETAPNGAVIPYGRIRKWIAERI